MGILIVKYWLIVLPTTLTGLYLLRLMKQLSKRKEALQPALITIRKED